MARRGLTKTDALETAAKMLQGDILREQWARLASIEQAFITAALLQAMPYRFFQTFGGAVWRPRQSFQAAVEQILLFDSPNKSRIQNVIRDMVDFEFAVVVAGQNTSVRYGFVPMPALDQLVASHKNTDVLDDVWRQMNHSAGLRQLKQKAETIARSVASMTGVSTANTASLIIEALRAGLNPKLFEELVRQLQTK